MKLLEVDGVSTLYSSDRGPVRAVDNVSFALERGEVLGIVGESGCGKTTLAMSILRLVRPPGKIVAGRVVFEGQDLFKIPRASMRTVRGARIALIPQGAMNALDPMFTAQSLVAEVIRAHREVSRQEARAQASELLVSVGIPIERHGAYPHELSGGMRQRVVIAMALANQPSMVIADEPATGLDVIVQTRILGLLRRLKAELGVSMILISHDLPLVAHESDSLLVMYAGRVAEYGPAGKVASEPKHPYTQGLLAAFPRLDGPRGEAVSIPGDIPDLVAPPPGCAFHPRCRFAFARCLDEEPKLRETDPGQHTACHLYE